MSTTTAHIDVRSNTSNFYMLFCVVCAGIAFGAFAPTYWLQLPGGTFVGSPLLHLHAVLFSLWMIMLIWQATLVARGRLRFHRAWGLAGIALASLMVAVGSGVAIEELRAGLAAGYADRARAFAIVPFFAIALFAGFFTAAMFTIGRPEAHKRLILLATIALLQAAMARVFFFMHVGMVAGARPGLGVPPPVAMAAIPSFCLEILVGAGMLHDWRTRGRPHPTWEIGAALLAVEIVARTVLADTSGWLGTADFLARVLSGD
jgi:hypothetical protein